MRVILIMMILMICRIAQGQSEITDIFQGICQALQVPASKQPKLIIRNSGLAGASYSPKEHTIYIEKKLIDGLNQLDGQRREALAFILGHELCHALEKDKHDTHFLAYDKAKGTTYQIEQNADIQGAFVAYLAGYNCLPVMAEAMEVIYQTYQLKDDLTGYPPKADRIESVELVREQVASLIALFKAANLLVLSGQHATAAFLFEQIYRYFPSPEVSLNIGTNLMLQAMDLGKYKILNYALPIELSWELRLKKPEPPAGQKEFEPEVMRRRDLLFRRADILFKDLLRLHPDYFPAWNNLVCLKILQQDLKGAAMILAETSRKFQNKDKADYLRFLKGTLYLLENKKAQAQNEFRHIQSAWLKTLSDQNLNQGLVLGTGTPACRIAWSDQAPTQNPLLQEKTIRLDTLSVTWSRDKITLKSPQGKKEFSWVEMRPDQVKACKPQQAFHLGGMKWNDSLVSIPDPATRKQVFYTVN